MSVSGGDDVAYQDVFILLVSSGHHDTGIYLRVLREDRSDFVRLHTHSSDFDLIIEAAEDFQ